MNHDHSLAASYFFNSLLEMSSERAVAIKGIGPGLEFLEKDKCSEIAKMIYGDHAKALTDPGHIAGAIEGIGPGLKHLEQEERSEIAKMIYGDHPKANAFHSRTRW